jgi:hypothetical protein
MTESVWGYLQVLRQLKKEKKLTNKIMTSFTNFYKISDFFHFRGAFMIFSSFSMCFYHIL